MRATPLAAIAGLLLAASGFAQMTWVVGPGGHFIAIQPALDAAADGDTILVRAGTYDELLTTSKGVHIAADPGVVIGLLGSLTVSNLAAGKTFTLSKVAFAQVGRISVRDCAGRVHLEELTLPSATVSNLFSVSNCSQITLTQVTSFGLPALKIERSRAVLMGCRLIASHWVTSWPALTISGSDVTIVSGVAGGGPSALTPAAPAVRLQSGTLTLAGRDTVISAGDDSTGVPVSAVDAITGRVDVEPAVTLVGRNGAPGIGGAATLVVRRIPSVRGDGLAPLGTWILDLHAPTASPFCLFASLPQARAVTPYGEVWFDLGAHVVLACGAVGAGNAFVLNVPLPNLPRGLPIVAQGAVALGAGIEVTTPAVNVVE